jgi:hypothetical protein
MIISVKFLFLILCISHVKGFDWKRYWLVSCRSLQCETGLQFSIASNCLGPRDCRAVIDEYYPSCSLCANEILDTSHHELVNGKYYPICDSTDDLHVKACLFYCRSNWSKMGTCIELDNIPICTCAKQIESAATTTTIITTPPTTTM